ncbi:hypothetical protein [Synechococcus sp. MIT S1220]|uniref:hypothetical protein n=1 Tax=Synechococcus sp. MIT S1220 TaxID=3082549 RepID=UPI0039AF663E
MARAPHHGSSQGSGGGSDQHEQTWDAVETYFECITTCSLDDGECITRCVDQLRDSEA